MLGLLQGYAKKWVIADLFIILDILQNAIGQPQYEALGNLLGIDSGAVNGIISVLEIVRFIVLAKHEGDSNKKDAK